MKFKNLTIESAIKELKKYSGYPKCMDCKWKLHTDITDNCGCSTIMTLEKQLKHNIAFNRARILQEFLIQNNAFDRFLEETKYNPDSFPKLRN